jgi:tRNA(fMet)-specific endonuclease VapC
LLQFLAILTVLPFDDGAAVTYGDVCADLHRKGTAIGTIDMLIAAHAKSENLTLITSNAGKFARIPELKIENWVD